MALDGPAFASMASRVLGYLKGADPCMVVPFGGGAGVAFVPERETHRAEAVEGGGLVDASELVGWFAAVLTIGSKWTYNGRTWLVAAVAVGKAAGSSWPHMVTFAGFTVGASVAVNA